MKPRVPMSLPDIGEAERRAVAEVMQTTCLSFGPWLTEFERRVADYVGARHAIAVSSGTAGLHLCMVAAGIGESDLVLTTPFSFVASANVALYERAVPVFVDIDPLTLNIDTDDLMAAADDLMAGGQRREARLPPALRDGAGSAGRLRAILPVHVFGQPTDMDPVSELATRLDLAVIEDACEAIGAEYKGRSVGTLGDAAVLAFYPNKQMTTGEGGVIVTDHEPWDPLFRSLRNQGRDVFDAWLNHSRLGYNYRMDELSAALGAVQLERIEELLSGRERVARLYGERLGDQEAVATPFVAESTTRLSWFVYVVRLNPEIDRDGVMATLEQRGIPARPYFTPIHLQPFYRERFGYREGDFPVTESVATSTLALPFFGTMTEEQVDVVCRELLEAVREPVTVHPRSGAGSY